MQLKYTSEQNVFRAEVRDWLQTHVPHEQFASHDTKEGFEQHRHWEATLADGGWSSVTWPKDLGGRGCDLIQWLIFEEEYAAADAPFRVNQNGILLLGPTLMEFGTAAQKAKFLPRMARCDDMWAQGWSEPNAGSDMAAISSKAIRDGDHYVLNGQKTWSTRAIFANWLFGLFRSDPTSSRHHGLSYLLVPLDAPGLTIRPIQALNGKQAFAEIFFDDVRVSADNLLGEEGQGWNVAMATAGFERGLLLRSPADSGTDKAVIPCSANLLRSSVERPASVCQMARNFSGAASTIKKRLMASRKACWSSLKVKFMISLFNFLASQASAQQ